MAIDYTSENALALADFKTPSKQLSIVDIYSNTFALLEEAEKSFDVLVERLREVLSQTPQVNSSLSGDKIEEKFSSPMAMRIRELNKKLESFRAKINYTKQSIEL